MRQRVVIAMALVMNPALVIADEPTTALDVTIQAQILELLARSAAAIRHVDSAHHARLGVVAETASRVIVMYGGEIVEEASVTRSVRARAPSVHRRPARRDAAGRPGARATRDDPGIRSAADGVAEGLPLPRPLPVRVGAVRHRASAALSDRRGAHVALPSRRRAAASRRNDTSRSSRAS